MAHPHASDRQHIVEHRRIAHITKGYATGGVVTPTKVSRQPAPKTASSKPAMRMAGGAVKARADKRARGGKVKHKGTTVNVMVAPQHAAGGAPMMPPPGVMPPHPPMAAPPMPPPGGPPGLPPGPGMPMGARPMMPPGGMPPRQAGGRTYARGGRVKDGPAWKEGLRNGTQVQHADGKQDQLNMNRGKAITYARGGGIGDPHAGDLSQPDHGAKVPHPESRKRTGEKHEFTFERARGGKVESPDGVAKATRLPGGSGGGEARLTKERRARKINKPVAGLYSDQ